MPSISGVCVSCGTACVLWDKGSGCPRSCASQETRLRSVEFLSLQCSKPSDASVMFQYLTKDARPLGLFVNSEPTLFGLRAEQIQVAALWFVKNLGKWRKHLWTEDTAGLSVSCSEVCLLYEISVLVLPYLIRVSGVNNNNIGQSFLWT
jgi:hypothetical protein